MIKENKEVWVDLPALQLYLAIKERFFGRMLAHRTGLSFAA
jgi:hypothetical protein